jgi:long-chain acyl-CoA synthetase
MNTKAEVRPGDLEQARNALERGMTLAYHAARRPDNLAVISEYGDRTFAELNRRANQLVRLLRSHGIGPGDAIAVVLKNRPEFLETLSASQRAGLRITPVNWHLKADEVGYVLDNCEARAVVYDGALATAEAALREAPGCKLRLMVGGSAPGFEEYDQAIAGFDASDIDDPVRGTQMLYTSGTTGRPKGVYRGNTPAPGSQAALAGANAQAAAAAAQATTRTMSAAAYNPDTDRCLCTGPAYHAAPLAFNIQSPMAAGVGIVLMDRWDPEETLRLVDEYKITHTHMVATMFHRLLQLPDEVKQKYDVSSLRYLLHGAAPCPVHVKQAMMDWVGPIIYEYYAATEGGGNYFIGPEEWLRKPGSVGRSPSPENTKVLDEDGNELPAGETGTIYFKAPEVGRFEYYKAPDKTASSYRGDYFTLGDMGYLDEDGYLFLTGRSAETIISGGVNIYPQEIDEALLQHEAVQDVCTVGVPNEEWGEEVKSVVQLNPGYEPGPEMATTLIEFARSRLPGFKVPRSIDFATDLPRLQSGKIQRRTVREPYWAGRAKQI